MSGCCHGNRNLTMDTEKCLWKERSELTYLMPAAAKLLPSCPTLRNPIDGNPPGSAIPGILQARTLEWAVVSFSNTWKWKVTVKSLRRVRLLATPWTAVFQAPQSMGFSRQEYWSGVPLPSLIWYLDCFKQPSTETKQPLEVLWKQLFWYLCI